MRSQTKTADLRDVQGFDVYTVSNADVELAVVPELGAKIISLKNLKTGRECGIPRKV
jgi:hypothetical protein